jgi:hypothetical protein
MDSDSYNTALMAIVKAYSKAAKTVRNFYMKLPEFDYHCTHNPCLGTCYFSSSNQRKFESSFLNRFSNASVEYSGVVETMTGAGHNNVVLRLRSMLESPWIQVTISQTSRGTRLQAHPSELITASCKYFSYESSWAIMANRKSGELIDIKEAPCKVLKPIVMICILRRGQDRTTYYPGDEVTEGMMDEMSETKVEHAVEATDLFVSSFDENNLRKEQEKTRSKRDEIRKTSADSTRQQLRVRRGSFSKAASVVGISLSRKGSDKGSVGSYAEDPFSSKGRARRAMRR